MPPEKHEFDHGMARSDARGDHVSLTTRKSEVSVSSCGSSVWLMWMALPCLDPASVGGGGLESETILVNTTERHLQ